MDIPCSIYIYYFCCINTFSQIMNTTIFRIFLLFIIDVLFCLCIYFFADNDDIFNDGLTTFYYSCAISVIYSILYIFLFDESSDWSLATFINIPVLFFVFNLLFPYWVSDTTYRKWNTDYKFEYNDSTFHLNIHSLKSEFDIKYEDNNFVTHLCSGTFQMTERGDYVLKSDSTFGSEYGLCFIVKNDSIIGFKDVTIKLTKYNP
jgi:hypothetical protein